MPNYNKMSKEELLRELQKSEEKLQIALTQKITLKNEEKKATRTFSLTDSELRKFEETGRKNGYKNRSQFLSHIIDKF